MVLSSRYLIDNQWIKVRVDTCRTSRGVTIEDYYVVEKPDFTMVVAITDDGKLVTIREYKHGCGGVVLQLPAGYLEPGEDPAHNAVRELREETGYEASRVEHLASLCSSTGIMTNRAHIFLCTGLRAAGPQEMDVQEDIEVHLVDFEDAVAQVCQGRLLEGTAAVAAVLLAWMHRQKQK
jgi:8-oxo-dGTP pyrophosphatase MutT (NUDIX family)